MRVFGGIGGASWEGGRERAGRWTGVGGGDVVEECGGAAVKQGQGGEGTLDCALEYWDMEFDSSDYSGRDWGGL